MKQNNQRKLILNNICILILKTQMYKLYISDREYKEQSVVFSKDLKPTSIKIDALKNKMFTQDIFDLNDEHVIMSANI